MQGPVHPHFATLEANSMASKQVNKPPFQQEHRTSESSAPFRLFFPLAKGSGIGRSLMVKVQPPPASFSASPLLSSLRLVALSLALLF